MSDETKDKPHPDIPWPVCPYCGDRMEPIEYVGSMRFIPVLGLYVRPNSKRKNSQGELRMSDKQLTGTITLPGVDPELYELTGEYRQAKRGECYSDWMGTPRIHDSSDRTASVFPILRRKPRKIRVTPTQADLDAATEPIPCWVRDYTNQGWCPDKLTGITKFGPRQFATKTNTWKFCEIEKEVTE